MWGVNNGDIWKKLWLEQQMIIKRKLREKKLKRILGK